MPRDVIATNMAGRGVDIKLGGDRGRRPISAASTCSEPSGTSFSRRIDNQLRGRSGCQGDPGETRFYLSGLEDDLVRLFAGDRIHNIMERFKLPDDQPHGERNLSRQIENAQRSASRSRTSSRGRTSSSTTT